MDKDNFFEEWKSDWRDREREFDTDQAELFRKIRDRKNLEKRLERDLKETVTVCGFAFFDDFCRARSLTPVFR